MELRRNRRYLHYKIADEMADASAWEQLALFKRFMALTGDQEVGQSQVDPDQYADVMQSLQPSLETTPLV